LKNNFKKPLKAFLRAPLERSWGRPKVPEPGPGLLWGLLERSLMRPPKILLNAFKSPLKGL